MPGMDRACGCKSAPRRRADASGEAGRALREHEYCGGSKGLNMPVE
jgi:hypothetical protein